MHPEVIGFLTALKQRRPELFKGRILEAGSMDVNGNPRGFFAGATEYVGLDWRPGPGVDAVGLIHDWNGRPDGHFDVVLSTETLEHDPYWQKSIGGMVRLVRKGGSIIITCAGPGRGVHYIETSPTGSYYENRTIVEVMAELWIAAKFKEYVAEWDPSVFDTRVVAIGKLS
jgi:SAM-dependent methyltransferase